MYGFMPSATTEKCDRPPPEKRSSSPTSGVALDELLELRLVDARDRDRRQEAEDDQQPEDIEDPPADVGRAKGVEKGFEHGSGVVAGRPLGVVARVGRRRGRRRGRFVGRGGSSAGSASSAGSSASAAALAAFAAGFAQPCRSMPWRMLPWRRSPCPASAAGSASSSATRSRRSRRRRGRGLGLVSFGAAFASASPWPWPASVVRSPSGVRSLGRHAQRRERRRRDLEDVDAATGRLDLDGAEAVNASATTNNGTDSSPAPRIFSGLLRVRTSPTARRMSWFTVIGPDFGRLLGVLEFERAAIRERADGPDVHDLVLDLEPVFEAPASGCAYGVGSGHPPQQGCRRRHAPSGPWCRGPRSCPCRRRCHGRRGCVACATREPAGGRGVS